MILPRRARWQGDAAGYSAREVTTETTETQPADSRAPSSMANPEENQQTASEVPISDASSPLDDARQEAARMKDQLLRTAADFDNYRKRSRRDVSDAERKGRDDLLKDLLPVFDNLERATSHATSHELPEVRAVVEGIHIVLRQFQDTLGRLNVERVKTVGEAFDPAHHEAIQHLETTEYAPGVVAAEVQSGYRQAERVIRPALVVVAKAPPARDESLTNPGDGN
jgi:molecular chaperone GrpE